MLLFPLLLGSLLFPAVCANLHAAIPEDLYAFPKYRIAFLNAFPVSNETAQTWLTEGLQGGELEFLGQWHPSPRKTITSQSASIQQKEQCAATEPASHIPDQDQDHHHHHHHHHQPNTLKHMRLGHAKKSYLCLIPPAPSLPPPIPDDAQAPVTPSHSWSLLQPLSGTCLYHRQAWFTYSYCHNSHVRQFRELPATYPHPPGVRVVEEDPEWEAYTLGQSPVAQGPVEGIPAANVQLALANNLELARQAAGHRYLVQRWGDGTACDKTGRPREVEVQFHCSMTMTDTILFVKETRTCEYVLVIHTPRLCGEPGFKSRHEQMPETPIRCRQILDAGVEPPAPSSSSPDSGLIDPLRESLHPRRSGGGGGNKPVPPPPPPKPAKQAPNAKAPADKDKDKSDKVTLSNFLDTAEEQMKLIQKAIDKVFGKSMAEDMAILLHQGEEDGEFYITLEDGQGGEYDVNTETDDGGNDDLDVEPKMDKAKALKDALRALAGQNVLTGKQQQQQQASGKTTQPESDNNKKKEKKEEGRAAGEVRDEL